MIRVFLLLFTVGLALPLSGCLTTMSETNSFTTVEGEWNDDHGIISTFHNGMMTTHAPDTQEKLAEGNYLTLANGRIRIQLRSLVRGTSSLIECGLDSKGSTLTCAPTAGGVPFSLHRKLS